MSINRWLFRIQFTAKKQKQLFKNLFTLINSNVPASGALEHMLRQYEINKDHVMAAVVTDMVSNIKAGKKIAENMEDWLPFEICRILVISEENDLLIEGLNHIINYLDTKQLSLKNLLWIAPGFFYFIITLMLIVMFGHYLLPGISQYAHDIPFSARLLEDVGSFLYQYSYVIIILFIYLLLWIYLSLKYYSGKLTQIVVKPFLSTYKLYHSFLLLKSLGMLIENGESAADAIKVLQLNRKKGYLYFQLNDMISRIAAGEHNIGEVLDTGVFTRNQVGDIKIIATYCSDQEFSKIFLEMANKTADQVQWRFKTLSKAINFIFILLTAFGLTWAWGSFTLLVRSIS